MRTASLPLPIVSPGDAEAAPVGGDRPGLPPAPGPSIGSAFNLSRPWKFPGAHADRIHCRRHPRTLVQVPVDISLVRPDGSTYDKGTGVIRDLSCSGLRLGDVVLARGRLLAAHFAVELRPTLESPAGPDIAGRILRTFSPGFPGFGIEFLRPGSGVVARLRKMDRRETAPGLETAPPLDAQVLSPIGS